MSHPSSCHYLMPAITRSKTRQLIDKINSTDPYYSRYLKTVRQSGSSSIVTKLESLLKREQTPDVEELVRAVIDLHQESEMKRSQDHGLHILGDIIFKALAPLRSYLSKCPDPDDSTKVIKFNTTKFMSLWKDSGKTSGGWPTIRHEKLIFSESSSPISLLEKPRIRSMCKQSMTVTKHGWLSTTNAVIWYTEDSTKWRLKWCGMLSKVFAIKLNQVRRLWQTRGWFNLFKHMLLGYGDLHVLHQSKQQLSSRCRCGEAVSWCDWQSWIRIFPLHFRISYPMSILQRLPSSTLLFEFVSAWFRILNCTLMLKCMFLEEKWKPTYTSCFKLRSNKTCLKECFVLNPQYSYCT